MLSREQLQLFLTNELPMRGAQGVPPRATTALVAHVADVLAEDYFMYVSVAKSVKILQVTHRAN